MGCGAENLKTGIEGAKWGLRPVWEGPLGLVGRENRKPGINGVSRSGPGWFWPLPKSSPSVWLDFATFVVDWFASNHRRENDAEPNHLLGGDAKTNQ